MFTMQQKCCYWISSETKFNTIIKEPPENMNWGGFQMKWGQHN